MNLYSKFNHESKSKSGSRIEVGKNVRVSKSIEQRSSYNGPVMPKASVVKKNAKVGIFDQSLTEVLEAKTSKRLAMKKNALANNIQDRKPSYEPLAPLELSS